METWLERLNASLRASGWNVIVALTKGRYFHHPDNYRAAHPDLETRDIDGSSRTHEGRTAAVRKLIRREKPDIAVVCGLVDAIAGIAAEKQKGLQTRLICVAHGLGAGPFADFRKFQPFIDGAVGVSVLSQQLFIDWVGIDSDRTSHITNGATNVAGASHRECTNGVIKLAYCGRLEQSEKQIHDLPVLIRRMDDAGIKYSLRIAGDGPERIWLLSQLEGHLQSSVVQYLGWLRDCELQEKVYSWAHGALVFSPAEGGCPPISLAEAMHCGCIPISSQFLGLAAENILIDRFNALLFPVGDMTAACERIAEITTDDIKLANLSANALATARERLCVDYQLRKWCQFFENALNRPSVTPQTPVPRTSECSGRLERWRVPTALATGIRKWFTTGAIPQEPGAEWPHHSALTAETEHSFNDASRRLDSPAGAHHK